MNIYGIIKKIIIERYNKEYKQANLNEYITSDIVYLRDYFKMSAEDKKRHLPQEYSYLFDDFLQDEGIDLEDSIGGETDIDESIELVEWLERNNHYLFDEFANYLYDRVTTHDLPIPDSEYPAWSFFDDRTQLIKNQWLIHFTEEAQKIAEEGFRYGVDDMTKLGLTTQLGEFDKKYGGYNFAYTLNDFNRYGKSDYMGGNKEYKYGSEAVIFNASGIKVWHHGDGEPQVIFYGNTAKNIIPIIGGDQYKYGVYNKGGRLLYENDEMEAMVKWITNNYQQYRKQFF